MRARPRTMNLMLLVAGLASSMAVGACYHHHEYDNDDRRGARWSATEEPYYERWEQDRHKDHRDYNQRQNDEQHDYWQWRQSHQQ
jgi:hypothetical protein